MADTYTQLDVQLVFAVKGRESLIQKPWRDELYQYITGIVQSHRHKMLRINGMPDHVHIFIGYHPTQLIPMLVEEIKTSSNKFIKEKGFAAHKFSWQKGYGAFSYSRSHRDAVIKYIDNQEQHHRKKTFREEYLAFLEKFEIEYQEKYLFDFQEIYSW